MLPSCLYGILRYHPVACHDNKPFFQRLCDKKPIKRIAVYVGKRLYAFKMLNFNWNTMDSRQATLAIKV